MRVVVPLQDPLDDVPVFEVGATLFDAALALFAELLRVNRGLALVWA
jgi:hypothetical protein